MQTNVEILWACPLVVNVLDPDTTNRLLGSYQ